jgi:outer membrane protein TolC
MQTNSICRAFPLLAAAGAACLIAACTTQPGPTLDEAVPDLASRAGTALPPETPWEAPPSGWDGRAPLTAQTVITTALQHNRALRRSLLEIDRLRARYRDSQLAPNPTLELAGGIPLGAGAAPILAMVSAQIDWLWKREALVGESDAALRAALFQAAAMTVTTAIESRAAYVQAASAWELLALTLADVETATHVVEATRAAFAAGESRASAVNDADMTLADASSRAMEAEQAYVNAQLSLLSVMGQGNLDTQWEIVAKTARAAADECALQPALPPLDHQDLFKMVRAHRLDLVAADARVQGAQARAQLARASQWPNVSVGGGWERDMNGDTAAMIGGSITLPIFNQGQFRVQAAEAELAIARIDADALLQQALIDVRRALSTVAQAEHHAVQIRDVTLKALDANQALLAASVDVGETPTLRLWQAQRQQNRARTQLAAAQRDAVLASLGVEHVLAGAALPGSASAGTSMGGPMHAGTSAMPADAPPDLGTAVLEGMR